MRSNGNNLRRVIGIVMSLVVGVGVAAVAVAVKAKAQARYDPDQQWIRRTLHVERRREELSDGWRERQRRRSYEPRRHYDQSRREPDYYPGTAVYGVVMRKGSTTVRDATGHVECFPPIEARSHERQSEDTAWDDAQRSWQNTVRWKYGERFQGIQHASAIERRCNISTVSESIAGKMVEAVRGAVGADDTGRRWRCEVRASPCLAPVNIDPNIKGDAKAQ